MITNEGPTSLFRGMIPPLVTSTTVNAVIFSSYNMSLKQISIWKDGTAPTVADTFLAGAFAGLCQTIITCPTDVIKVRLQGADHTYKGPLDCMYKTYKSYGIRGLFKGYFVTFSRDCPSFGSYFCSYYLIKDNLRDSVGDLTSQFIAGALAGAISWSASYPLDVAKTTIQMNPEENRSISRVIRDITREHGVKFLYRGFGTTVLRSLPVNAVVFPVYEITTELLHAMQH
jgi:solute carrier family 25 carnitine/acylcarnitine transporter 20/29